MPLNRYQLRNEYCLADPELYKVADKDDPEALLEGVAMAGLVGVLRQLGDLAEFAAEIFHDLHEEVMATAARGHGLIVRVQQLDAEFPSIERTLLSQTSHTAFLYNTGVDWHPNLRMDQSVVTRGDLPRFVMDSYEECRGPPRLFLLDKYDVAGAGACLKRFTDPSFFKMESTSSIGRKLEGQREKKTRRVKKRGPRWRNGDTPESFPSSHAKLHQLFLEERIESGINDPARRVKLKKRQFTGSLFEQDNVRSYMEKFLDTSAPKQKILHEMCIDPLQLTWTSDKVCEAGLEIVEIGAISPVKESRLTERSLCSSPDAKEMGVKPLMDDLSQDKLNVTSDNESVEVPGLNNESNVGNVSTVPKEVRVDDACDFDDVASEIDNYVDALANIESEVETEYECKKQPRYLNWKPVVADSDGSERQRRLQSFSLDSQSIGNSATSDDGDLFFKERESSSCSNSVKTLSETAPDLDAAVVAVSTIQASNSDSDNMSFDHHSTSEEILRKEREKHASGNTVLTEVDEILKSEQKYREASNAPSLSDLNKNLPVDMEASLKENPFLSDPESEDSAKSHVVLGEPDQGHAIQTNTTFSDAFEDSRHCSGVDPFSYDKEGQYTSADPDMSQGMTNIFDASVHLLETNSHTSACSSVEGPDKNLARADTDSGLPSQHEPISEPAYLEKTTSIYLACEEDFLISSTEENLKDIYSATESSVSYGLKELIPGIINPGRTSSLDIAAGNLSWSREDPSMQSSIAMNEGRISSAPHAGQAENFAIFNELQSCARETSSSEFTETAEINDCGFLEADVAVVASSKDESNCEVSEIADERGINESSKVAKPSNMIDVLESQDEWLKLSPEATDTTPPESSQDEASKQYYDNDACTRCLIPVAGNEDEASVHFGYIEREPVDQDFSSIYPDRTKVFEPDNLANDPASEPATMRGEANVDYGLADQDGEEDKIFNQGLSSPEAPFKHADDSDYTLVAENYSDLDHDVEKVEHFEIVADGHDENVNVDHHPNEILSTSLVLPPEKLHEPPLLDTEKLWQSDEEFSKGHSGELTERRQVDLAQDASVTPTANMRNTPSNDSSPLISLDDALPEDVKINDNPAAEAPLAFDRSSEHLEPTSSHQFNLLEANDLDLLNHNLLKPQHCEKEKSAGPAALHYDDQPAASKTSPESAEHTLETSSLGLHCNGMLSSADQATQVENSAQPLTQSGFTDLGKCPAEPQINLEPPSLPPLPPMQWRLGRFQNAAAVSAERQMVQHTFAPVQVPSMGLPTMHHNLAPVQPMNLAAVHQALASFQPVALAAGNNTVTPIPLASQPSSLPAVYTFAPLQPVTLQTTDYGTETIARTISSEGQLGYSDGYMAQQGVYALPVPVALSEGFYQMNMNAVGRQDNLPSTVPLTSTNLDGYVTQPGVFVTPIPAVVSEGSSQIDSSGVGRPHSLPLSVSPSPSRSPNGTQILEASYQPNVDVPESGSLVEDHFSEHRSTMEATVNAETDIQNELLEHAHFPGETVNSYVQPLLSSAADQPPPGLVAPEAARTWSSTYDEIPTHTDGNINGTLQKKPPRPRNPLIDEVVAIDKSKLRKVERTKPPVESKQEEADHRLEQMQLRKVERVKPPVESKVEGGEYRLEQLQLRKVGERVKAPVEQKAEEEFSLEQLQLRKVGERVKSAVEPKSEEKEFLLEQLQLRKVGLKPKLEAEPKAEETGSPLAQLRKVRERVREEFELKAEETESPRLQLRKVGERAQTQVEEKVEERDSLFEQIRNKSFSLKPAVAARPNIQGPRTNLKVAAILEKASTIRQAMAGSDEDEDGDSWSDS